MVDPEKVELPEWFLIGTVVYLGVSCPECGCDHPCDAVCFRFSPRTYYCPSCKSYKRHGLMDKLIKLYRMRKLLVPGG